MFSKACEYSIRALIYIAKATRDGSTKVGIDEIAKSTDSPRPFTARILQDLSKQGLVSSVKGPHGGFYFERGKKVYLVDVVRAIDGTSLFTNCGLGIKKCSETRPCPVHNEFKKIRDELIQMLKNNTVQDMADQLHSGEVFLRK
jgi:Rrf2 family transcriptional regulator, iron-sulfur cluster assembly transcription factor